MIGALLALVLMGLGWMFVFRVCPTFNGCYNGFCCKCAKIWGYTWILFTSVVIGIFIEVITDYFSHTFIKIYSK
jgi:hypothetical protein